MIPKRINLRNNQTTKRINPMFILIGKKLLASIFFQRKMKRRKMRKMTQSMKVNPPMKANSPKGIFTS